MMNASFSEFDPRDERGEEGDPVWALLARADLSEPDAWFAVRTLARCRHERGGAASRAVILDRVWRWALGAGLGVCAAIFLMARVHPAAPVPTNQKGVQEAFEIMATMAPDADSSSSANNSSWQDSSL